MKRRECERGWGPWRKRWVSICGLHLSYEKGCDECDAGSWIGCWRMAYHRVLYRLSPSMWERLVNRHPRSGF